MNKFFIKEVAAHSHSGTKSAIALEPGVNIICGPSNTGKSMIIASIDYLFGGSKEPFDPSIEGYDRVSMTLVNRDGERIVVHRSIEVKDGNARPTNAVAIMSDIAEIPSGDYRLTRDRGSSRKSYGDILLEMLDINKPVKIIASQDGKPKALSTRVFFHQFCIKENDIFKDKTIIDNPGHSSITYTINALAYLLYEGGVRDEEYEDPKIKAAKKRAVIAYISEKVASISAKREELCQRLDSMDDVDIQTRISEIIDEISAIENQILHARQKSQKLLSDIYKTSDKLAEEKQLAENYHALHSQYKSDIKRLRFIVEGENATKRKGANQCPFCNGEIIEPEERESFVEASAAELEKVYLHIADLETLEKATAEQIDELERELDLLNSKDSDIKRLISREFTPKARTLHQELENYERVLQLQKELDALDILDEEYASDINEKAQEDDKAAVFDAKAMFKPLVFNRLSAAVESAIKACHYPDCRSAGLSLNTFDVIVNSKDKKHEGKGYKAFLNSLFAFVLMKFIEKDGKHAPKLLILDSPVLSLKEDVDIQATASMKSSLFEYIIDNCGDCQVLIAENTLPAGVDYTTTNIIEFGKSDNMRRGFLLKK